MNDEEVFKSPRMKGAMDALMKSEEGREIAAKLREKLKALNDQFKDLTGDEKVTFLKEFKHKFADSLGDIAGGNLGVGGDSDGAFKIRGDEELLAPQTQFFYYLPFILAFTFICLVFG